MEYNTTSMEDLRQVVKELLLEIPPNAIFELQGHPGAGKTTLVKEAARLLDAKEPVQSPTFNIMNIYSGFYFDDSELNIFHLDCYRLSDSDFLLDLDFSEISGNQPFYAFIEWPEKVKINFLTSGIALYSIKLDTIWSSSKHKVIKRNLTRL